MTRGALPRRTWLESSRQVTSRRQWRPYLIPRWPRIRDPMSSLFPAVDVSEVTMWTVSADHFRVPSGRDLRGLGYTGELDPGSHADTFNDTLYLASIGGFVGLVSALICFPGKAHNWS